MSETKKDLCELYKALVIEAVEKAKPDTIMQTGDIVKVDGITYDVLILSWGDKNKRRATSPWKVSLRNTS